MSSKRNRKKMVCIKMRLPETLIEQLRIMAEEQGTTMAALARKYALEGAGLERARRSRKEFEASHHEPSREVHADFYEDDLPDIPI